MSESPEKLVARFNRRQTRGNRAHSAHLIAVGVALLGATLGAPAVAQSSGSLPPLPPSGPDSTSRSSSDGQPASAQPPSGGQPSPAPAPYPPSSYQQPGYQQPQYQQQPGGYPPGYGQPGQPGDGRPMYGQPQPPGYGGISEPPLPPPPKRTELQWSIRMQVLDLLFGRATGELEYAFAGPFSFTVIPEYIFAYPGVDKSDAVKVSGAGVAGEFGYWVEGRPLRGYFLKAHAGYRSIKFSSTIDEVSVPATQLGAMFGSQSVYGGWFTLSGGIGVVYDFNSEERSFRAGSAAAPTRYVIPASGLFGNGFDLLGQLSIGGSF
ncbi:MAG: hypothetical protein ABW133_19570 [Polyangiaceae bacterium]